MQVKPENKCDICDEKLAPYYDMTYYIHYCSDECFEQFINGYNREIDEIALEIKSADDLGEENNEV